MKSAITVSLVPEAQGGPFVFWNGLEDAFQQAAAEGFDAVEIFPPEASVLEGTLLKALMERHQLGVAAVGTGAGWVKHRLHLTHPEASVRSQARHFIAGIIVKAAQFRAPAILGSMQGRVEPGVEKAQALEWLGEALSEAGALAAAHGTEFLYEPLNRYETNLFNRQLDAADFLQQRGLGSVKILADLFHMNLEEQDLGATLRALGGTLGHVHFADSNRRAMGFGHTQGAPIIQALRSVGYGGYLSAEVLPLPDSHTAARQTMESFRALLA